MVDIVAQIVIGFLGGVIGGMLGVGGGILFVPAMVIILGTQQTTAQGVSLTVIIVTAVVAVAQHRRNRTIDYDVARWMILPAVLAGLGAGALAGEIEVEWLRRIFGIIAILVAIRMAVSAWKVRRRAPQEVPRP